MSRIETLGRVSGLWRYPVKSMAGEALNACEVTERGLLGDRAYALVDESNGVIASAKNPKVWPDLLNYKAVFTETPRLGSEIPPIRITLPDGRQITSDHRATKELSAVLGREIRLSSQPPERSVLQQFWPDLDGTVGIEPVTNELMPSGTFFDLAFVNMLFTSTLERLSRTHPEGQFDIQRFRPNILVAAETSGTDVQESRIVGRILAIGDTVRLRIDARCTRCVMTTLAQSDLPRDVDILRTVVRSNDGCAGLNVTVVNSGIIQVGDPVW